MSASADVWDCGHPLHAVRGPACDGDHRRPYTTARSDDGETQPEMPGWVCAGRIEDGGWLFTAPEGSQS